MYGEVADDGPYRQEQDGYDDRVAPQEAPRRLPEGQQSDDGQASEYQGQYEEQPPHLQAVDASYATGATAGEGFTYHQSDEAEDEPQYGCSEIRPQGQLSPR